MLNMERDQVEQAARELHLFVDRAQLCGGEPVAGLADRLRAFINYGLEQDTKERGEPLCACADVWPGQGHPADCPRVLAGLEEESVVEACSCKIPQPTPEKYCGYCGFPVNFQALQVKVYSVLSRLDIGGMTTAAADGMSVHFSWEDVAGLLRILEPAADDGAFDRAQTTAEALGFGPTVTEEEPRCEHGTHWAVHCKECAATGTPPTEAMKQRAQEVARQLKGDPSPSPRFGDRLRDLVVGETGFRHLDTQAGAVLVDIADAIDADRDKMQAEIDDLWTVEKATAEAMARAREKNRELAALAYDGQIYGTARLWRTKHAELDERMDGLRAKIEAVVERLRFSVSVGMLDDDSDRVRDIVDAEDLFAALAEIFGSEPAGDAELCCLVCGRPNTLHGINCETLLDDGEAARQTRERFADQVQESDERGWK